MVGKEEKSKNGYEMKRALSSHVMFGMRGITEYQHWERERERERVSTVNYHSTLSNYFSWNDVKGKYVHVIHSRLRESIADLKFFQYLN